MNVLAVLSLVADLYAQVQALTKERDALRAELATATEEDGS